MTDDRRIDPGDRAMTGSGPTGPRDGIDDEAERDPGAEPASEAEPPAGFTAAGGGYGVGSGEGGGAWLGTGGASEPDAPGEAPTDWIRSEETTAQDGEAERDDDVDRT